MNTQITQDAATVAATIRRQIGSDAWLAVSAREPGYFINDLGRVGLRFRFGPRHGLRQYMEIVYRPGDDDYSLWAYKVRRNGDVNTITECEGLYAETLSWLVREINQEVEGI